MPGRILSIQSAVVYGRVGHGATTYPLSQRGFDVWPLPTAVLSNHTGYAGWTGRRLPASEVDALLDGVIALGERPDAVLSGYLGTAATASVVARAVHAYEDAVYLCDPVLGDDAPGLYLPEDVGTAYRDALIPRARAVTPNRFELGWLTGRAVGTMAETAEAARALLASGPEIVFVTSVSPAPGQIGIMTVTRDAAWISTVAHRLHAPNGTGDLSAALLLADLLAGMAPARAAARTVAVVDAVLARTGMARELALADNDDLGDDADLPAIQDV